jgi:hypothetical protein
MAARPKVKDIWGFGAAGLVRQIPAIFPPDFRLISPHSATIGDECGGMFVDLVAIFALGLASVVFWNWLKRRQI